MTITVGQGIRTRMDDNGDDPLYGHAEGTVTNQDGSIYQYETCWGEKGFYISSNASGTWINAGPFGGAE